MVFQQPVLLRRSVAANIDYALRVRGRAAAERPTALQRALAARRGSTSSRTRPARVLSGGEQQRLALARALAVEPEILFLDEPTASLDPASTLAVEELIGRAHAAGTKIVLVTHDLGQARRLADEVVFLHRGRVVEQTPAGTVLRRPASRAGASLSRRPDRHLNKPKGEQPCCCARTVPGSLLALALPLGAASADDKFIIVQSTTSTEQSGLFGYLLPLFTDEDRHRGPRGRGRHRPGDQERPATATATCCSSTPSPTRRSSSPTATA